MKLLDISRDDIARYRTDGAVLIKNVLGPESLRLLETGIEEVRRAPGRHSKLSGAGGQGETMVAEYVSKHSPALRELIAGGVVGEVAATLMQTASAQIVLDQIFYKAPGPILPTPWHQDTPFLRVRGEELIRVWIPCDYSPREITVQVVRGSHRWNVVYKASAAGDVPAVIERSKDVHADGVGDPAAPPPPDVARHRDSFDILTWDVEPGDALVFQGNMLHGADGHPGYDKPRRAFAALLGGPNLQYYAPTGKAFPVPGDRTEAIAHGAAIGRHEGAFPVWWRASA